MGYIFVDIEFAEFSEGFQILEIGAYREKDTHGFFRLVRPRDIEQIPHKVYKLLKQTKQSLLQADSIDKIINEFLSYIRTGGDIIIWGDRNAEILRNCLEEHGAGERYTNLIDLHAVLLNIQDRSKIKSGFENVLREYNIIHDSGLLHRSYYDAGLLKILFYRIYDKYVDYIAPVKTDYIVNTRSKKIHNRKCRYLGYNLDIGYYSDYDAVYVLSGYDFCSCCKETSTDLIMRRPDKSVNKMHELRKKTLKYEGEKQFSQQAVMEMCILFELDYEILPMYILIKSSCGKWKIFHDNEKVTKLYHSNHIKNIEKAGFHEQELHHEDLYGTLDYISNHDQGAFRTKRKIRSDGTCRKKGNSSQRYEIKHDCKLSKKSVGKKAKKKNRHTHYIVKDKYKDIN